MIDHDPDSHCDPQENLLLASTLADTIGYCLEQADLLQRSIAVLEHAQLAPSPAKVYAVRSAARTRARIADRFAFSTPAVPVTESISQSSIVLVLEAEVAESKNILSRMIDAIIEAFKKLWNMITGSLGDSVSEEKAEKSAEDILKSLEDAVKNGAQLPANAALKSSKHAATVAYIGKNVAPGDLEKVAEAHLTYVDQVIAAVDTVSKRMADTKQLASKFKAETNVDEVLKALLEFNDGTVSDLKNAFKTPYDKSVFDRFGVLGENPSSDVQAMALGPILSPQGPAALIIAYAGQGDFKAAYKTKQVEDKEGAQITLNGSLANLTNFANKVGEFQKQVGKMNDLMRGRINNLKSDASGLQEALKTLKGLNDQASTPKATDGIKAFLKTARAIGSMQASLLATMAGLTKAAGTMGNLIRDAVKLTETKKAKADKTQTGFESGE